MERSQSVKKLSARNTVMNSKNTRYYEDDDELNDYTSANGSTKANLHRIKSSSRIE